MRNLETTFDHFDSTTVVPLGISIRHQQPAIAIDRAPASVLPHIPSDGSQLKVVWAKHHDDVVAAQKLRFQVFCGEMGAHLANPVGSTEQGLDQDEYDEHCEHLLIKDQSTSQVVGTYRLMMPLQAKRLGKTYIETQFDLGPMRHARDQMVELGRSCVHPAYRDGAVIRLLGGAIFKFMQANRFEQMIGCASIPMAYQGTRGGDAAASIWHRLMQSHLSDPAQRVRPHLPLPLAQLNHNVAIDPPPLISAYLRMGAKVLGPPSWDPHFNTADLPIMAALSDLPSRFRKYFLGE